MAYLIIIQRKDNVDHCTNCFGEFEQDRRMRIHIFNEWLSFSALYFCPILVQDKQLKYPYIHEKCVCHFLGEENAIHLVFSDMTLSYRLCITYMSCGHIYESTW